MQSHLMSENALRYMGADPHLAIQVNVIGQEVSFVAAGLGISSSNTLPPGNLHLSSRSPPL
ncbi:hypothetical protein [Mesorhizobium captivum]|uniref:hypothetical protein n=1 Tax=Mesorhizobium captivum TaxID=3072319 RepID=UPI002A23C4C9|nr:hypothetical protein [Mesorhizobium sp. VK22E]MDX8509783.1 hypothetical protein [Mesorhizobium sp. VK22E]